MTKDEIKVFNEIDEINKKIKSKKWNCIHENCIEFAINSHLLQENVVLNFISEQNHFFPQLVLVVGLAKRSYDL